jgi:beta-phosphoglucomutase-like phosphatase (HAD superfamily)
LAQTPVANCIVIEDSTNGILAAKAAGIYCIGYDSFHSKMQDYSKADMVISDFRALSYDTIRNIKS